MAEQHDTDKLLSLARECDDAVPTVDRLMYLAKEMASLFRAAPPSLPGNCLAAYDTKKAELRRDLTAYTERIRQEERERCAVICDELHDRQINSMCSHNYHRFAAAAIRSGASHG